MITKWFKIFFKNQYSSAGTLNTKNILDLVNLNKNAKFLDLGCDDGAFTKTISQKICTNNVYGIEIVDSEIKKAKKNKIKVFKKDLNKKLPFRDSFFDIIHANQVIEHINNIDVFMLEIKRVLKKGGYAIISTENASSWCNIFSSIMGWQIFSLTNFSSLSQGIGNPFSISSSTKSHSSWNHVRIWNINGLKSYFKILGFEVEKIKGAGYFPFPAIFGKFDVTHSHFITYKIIKNG